MRTALAYCNCTNCSYREICCQNRNLDANQNGDSSFDALKTNSRRGVVGYSARTKVRLGPDLTNHLRVPVINYYNEARSDQCWQSAHNYQREYVNEHAARENKAIEIPVIEVMECFWGFIQSYEQME